ncbi:MAG: GyrI-like domain-containing protein [Acidimicrobiia bacterium]|nr:GyrI-like domain-containing protein [Acidimicrobiia bacterium]
MADVRTVELDAMPVVSALGYGESPEEQAWDLILSYATESGLDPWDGTHRFLGFNNPDPSPGSPNYGYEQWITVPAGTTVSAPLEVKQFRGGSYAVLRLHGLEGIGEAWKELVTWVEDQGYEIAASEHACLEELLTPLDQPQETWEFDLYLGIVPLNNGQLLNRA